MGEAATKAQRDYARDLAVLCNDTVADQAARSKLASGHGGVPLTKRDASKIIGIFQKRIREGHGRTKPATMARMASRTQRRAGKR